MMPRGIWIAQLGAGLIAAGVARAIVNRRRSRPCTCPVNRERRTGGAAVTFALCYVVLNVATSRTAGATPSSAWRSVSPSGGVAFAVRRDLRCASTRPSRPRGSGGLFPGRRCGSYWCAARRRRRGGLTFPRATRRQGAGAQDDQHTAKPTTTDAGYPGRKRRALTHGRPGRPDSLQDHYLIEQMAVQPRAGPGAASRTPRAAAPSAGSRSQRRQRLHKAAVFQRTRTIRPGIRSPWWPGARQHGHLA